jgi:disulfide bond formation protein DsbB
MEAFSVLWFQLHLGLRPCEYCVKIRLTMIIITIGAFIALLGPRYLALKLPAYLVTIAGAITGLKLTISLEFINIQTLYLSNGFYQCTSGRLKLPLGLRPDLWLPTHFKPLGICGLDSQWDFLGFSMTQWLIMIHIVMLLGLTLMFASFIQNRIFKQK